MKPPLLDTHAWIWWLNGEERLDRATRDALDHLPAGSRPVISDISLWEVAALVGLGRLQLDRALESWLQAATSEHQHRGVQVWPITPYVAAEVARLPSSFHRDPADRLIVATARNRGLPLLTYDRRIADSGLVSLWSPR